jgi:hypothetical protein
MSTFVYFASNDLRDPASGRKVADSPPRQREHFLLRYPHLAAQMPEPSRAELTSPAFSTYTSPPREYGRYFSSQSPLLRDPAQSLVHKEPTQLRKVEYNKFRVSVHEASHCLIADALGLKLYRLTTNPQQEENTLGHLLHEPGTPQQEIIVLLAGREGELMMFGDAGEGDSGDVRHATKLARELNPSNPDEAMRIYRQAARSMVAERKRLISALAVALERKQELVLDQIYSAIATARKQIATDGQPARQVQSASSAPTSTSTRKGRTLTQAEMVQRFGPALVQTTAIMTGKQRA